MLKARHIQFLSLVAVLILGAATKEAAVAASSVSLASSVADTTHVINTAVDEEAVELDSVIYTMTATEAFQSMPDSLLPYLTRNNRLDMIDFVASGMKAEVTNAFDGKSELLSLAADSLVMRLSEALTVRMYLFPIVGEPVDGGKMAICMVRTWSTHPGEEESASSFYSVRWQPLPSIPLFSEADRQRIMYFIRSTVVKSVFDKINKS